MATAQQRQNSLASQRRQFNRTGRLTKGLQRAGGYAATEGQKDYTVQSGESLFSIAAATLGSGATQTQIAAYAQELAAANNGIQVLQSGAHIRLPSAVLTPDARPTKAFMEAANAQTVAGGFKVPDSVQTMQRELSLGAGSSTAAPEYSAAGFGLPPAPTYSPTRATQGLGAPAPIPAYSPSQSTQGVGQPSPSYNPQAIQGLGAGVTPSYKPGGFVYGNESIAGQTSSGAFAGLTNQGSGIRAKAPLPPGAQPPAGEQAPVNPWVEQQAAQLQGIMAALDKPGSSGAPGVTLPAYIPASVAQATGLYESALVQQGYYQTSMTGNLYLSATTQAALNLPEGGGYSGDLGTVYDYNRGVRQGSGYTRAIGVRSFRPRRGGVGATGSSTMEDTNPYASYGGALSGTWRVGF